jgi:hypothetical protein
MQSCDTTATYTDEKNTGFIARWNRIKQRKEIEMVGRLHSDICNVPTHLLPGFRMQIKLTKARPEFYLMYKDEDSIVTFKFLEAQLLFKRVRPNSAYLIAYNTAIEAGALATYNLTRVEVKSFTFASCSQSLSIYNAVFGTLRKRLLFAFTKNKDFLGNVELIPFQFRHYDISHFALFVYGKQIPRGGLHLDKGFEKMTYVIPLTLRSLRYSSFEHRTTDNT